MEEFCKLKPQSAPFTVQIEPVEGCNLGCSFCGLRGMREKGTKPWNFMTVSTAEDIAKKLASANWTAKIIFAMHGEPTLNPKLFDIVGTFRHYLPTNIMHIITNAHGIVKDEDGIVNYVEKLRSAGINHLLLDNYSEDGDWSKVIKALGDAYNIYYLGQDKTPMFRSDAKFSVIVLPPITTTNVGLMHSLANHAGAAFPLDRKYNDHRCTKPFRELSFRYDGNVALCCDDFRGEYPIGNIHDYHKVEDLWNNVRFRVARVMLYNKDRGFRPCDGCTNRSMRVGLLPDKLGKETLPKITDDVRMAAQLVSEDGPLSKIIIKRKWEK